MQIGGLAVNWWKRLRARRAAEQADRVEWCRALLAERYVIAFELFDGSTHTMSVGPMGRPFDGYGAVFPWIPAQARAAMMARDQLKSGLWLGDRLVRVREVSISRAPAIVENANRNATLPPSGIPR